MSSQRSRTLRDISQAPQTPRWKPSTPHGTRAQLHRSGGDRRRSGRIEKPWSAHNILKQLSRVEAVKPQTKSHLYESSLLEDTPSANKENEDETPKRPTSVYDDDDDDSTSDLPRPRLSITTLSSPDDEGSNIGPAPTPSILPDDDDDQNNNKTTRRHEDQDSDDGDDDDDDAEARESFTLKSVEYGRRAMPDRDRRFSRPSFGSIRMSDFRGGAADGDSGFGEQRTGKSPGQHDPTIFGDEDDGVVGLGHDDDDDDDGQHQFEDGDETEDLRLLRLRRSMSMPNQGDDTIHSINVDAQDEDTFRLLFNAAERRKSLAMPPPPVPVSEKSTTSTYEHPMFFEDRTLASSSPAGSTTSTSELETGARSPSIPPSKPTAAPSKATTRRKKMKMSKYDKPVPALPSSLIKRLGMDALVSIGRRKSRIGRESLKALEQATEWFFEQIGDDLEAFAEHAGRKRRIDESDVEALMKRQRNIPSMDSTHALAKEHLPKDVLRELDIP